MIVKLLQDHMEGCHAVKATEKGWWDSPWFVIAEGVYRDTIGRNHPHGHIRWLTFICNDPTCKAHGILKGNYLENLVDVLLERA